MYYSKFLVPIGLFCLFIFSLATISPPPSPGNPSLPAVPYDYSFNEDKIPGYFDYANGLSIPEIDNDVATLGNVLFYDVRLSRSQDLSCGSCHQQSNSFAESEQFSSGTDGALTARNSPGLNDLGWRNSKLFWDYRENDLEDLVLQPILEEGELAGSMDVIFNRMYDTDYYPDLFEKAFGSAIITEAKMAKALADFIRSMNTLNSRFDQSYRQEVAITDRENEGRQLFNTVCITCHLPYSYTHNPSTFARNNGLYAFYEDIGAGTEEGVGRFRSPSLRNIELTAPYMHDGSIATLEGVIDFYSEGLQMNPGSFNNEPPVYYAPVLHALADSTGFDFTIDEKLNLLAFLKSLTDWDMVTNPKFADPFKNELVGITAIEADRNITVFPNPARDRFTISYEGNDAEVMLYNGVGALMKSELGANGQALFQRGNLSAGIYFVKVSSPSFEYTSKVILE